MTTKVFCDGCDKFIGNTKFYKASFWNMPEEVCMYGDSPKNMDLCPDCYEKIMAFIDNWCGQSVAYNGL